MPRGSAKGERRGGRQKGAKNKATLEKEKKHDIIVEQAKAEGVLPLEVMLACMRKAWDEGQMKEAHGYAVDAAPYVHAKLSSTKVAGDDEAPLKTILEISWIPVSIVGG